MNAVCTIADIKQDVIDALQGRTDISDTMLARYVAKAARELTNSQQFSQLETDGPEVTLTIGQSQYPIAYFLNTGDSYSTPNVFSIFVDYPNNTVSNQIRYKTPPAIESMTASAVTGIPAWFTRFGNNFSFGPVPISPFTVSLSYQAKHPFSPTPSINDPLYIDVSWLDILAYDAAMRIAVVKRWTDQRKELHDMLFGDPEFINSDGKRGRPGLVSARTLQQERDEQFNSRSIGIVVGRYNYR